MVPCRVGDELVDIDRHGPVVLTGRTGRDEGNSQGAGDRLPGRLGRSGAVWTGDGGGLESGVLAGRSQLGRCCGYSGAAWLFRPQTPIFCQEIPSVPPSHVLGLSTTFRRCVVCLVGIPSHVHYDLQLDYFNLNRRSKTAPSEAALVSALRIPRTASDSRLPL